MYKNGIPESVANHIFDEMLDFAKYALINPMRQPMLLYPIKQLI